jgi:hypothetical protein
MTDIFVSHHSMSRIDASMPAASYAGKALTLRVGPGSSFYAFKETGLF